MKNNKEYQEWLEEVKDNGMAFLEVPNKYKTSEMCLEAVKQMGWNLQFVPEHLKTFELCEIAIKQDHGWSFCFVPTKFKV